jgi:hypothetical protein
VNQTRRLRHGWLTGLTAVALLLPADAWAYVDPGTGSYFFQLAAAALLAGTYMARQWLATLVGFVARMAGRGGTATAGDAGSGSGRHAGDRTS